VAAKKGGKGSTTTPAKRGKGSGRTGTRGVASPELAAILSENNAEKFWTLLNDTVFPRYERYGLEGLSRPEQVAHCIDWLVRETEAVGIRKWFEEIAGNYPYQTLDALKAIGADHTFELMEMLFGVFPEEVPNDQDERLAVMEDFTGRERRAFKEFDAAWRDYQDDHMGLLKDYLEEHAKEWGKE
jgi:uncharacterized protein DUF4375